MNAGIDIKESNPPHGGPAPSNAAPAAIFPGVPYKNSSENHPASAPEILQNHQPVAVSFTTPAAPTIVSKGEYHPGYIDQMLAFFDKPKMKKIVDSYTWKSGAVSEKERYVPNTPPHFSEFSRSIGVSTRRLKSWANLYPEFREAYETCQEILEEFLIDNGLVGAYGPIAMKFVAVNKTKMKDKVVTESRHMDLNKVLDQIAAGKVKPGGQMDLQAGDEDF